MKWIRSAAILAAIVLAAMGAPPGAMAVTTADNGSCAALLAIPVMEVAYADACAVSAGANIENATASATNIDLVDTAADVGVAGTSVMMTAGVLQAIRHATAEFTSVNPIAAVSVMKKPMSAVAVAISADVSVAGRMVMKCPIIVETGAGITRTTWTMEVAYVDVCPTVAAGLAFA